MFADHTLHHISPYLYLSIKTHTIALSVKDSLVMILILKQHTEPALSHCMIQDAACDNVTDHPPVITTLTLNISKCQLSNHRKKVVFMRHPISMKDSPYEGKLGLRAKN